MIIDSFNLWDNRTDVKLTAFVTNSDMIIEDLPLRPAVIICPGGAYYNCPIDCVDGYPVALDFAADGYQSFILQYTVFNSSNGRNTKFPVQLYDLVKAISFIKEHAKQWKIDPERIAILGFSAGAHLCSMLSVDWYKSYLQDKFCVEAEQFKPFCAILVYPIANYVNWDEFRRDEKMPELLPYDMNKATFGEINPDIEKLKRFSPCFQVTEHTVPMFIAATSDDSLVPPNGALDLAQALQKYGVSYEMHMFERGEHGFGLGKDRITPYMDNCQSDCHMWIPLAKKFLQRRISKPSKKS